MNQLKQSSRPLMRFYVIPALLLMLAFGASPEAARGQWATNSNNADINNTNTGNVGIGTGTTAPGEKLVVTGGGLFGGAFSRTSLWDTFSTGANPALFEINSGAAVSNSTRFAALSLITKQAGTSDAIGGIYFGNSNLTTPEKRVAAIAGSTDGATNSGMLNFATANGGALFDRMRITSSGNVGIGTGFPVSKLTVSDGNIHLQSAALVANGSMGDIGFGPGGSLYWSVGPRAFMRGYFQGPNWHSGTALSFFTHGGNDITANNNVAERMRIDKDGNVGIGTGAPVSKLTVSDGNIHLQSTALVANGSMGDIGFGPGGGQYQGIGPRAFMRGYFQGPNWHSGTALGFFTHGGGDITANGNAVERMRIDKDGNIGIGVAAPATRLDVAGQVKSSSGGFVFPDGTVQTTAATGSGSIAAGNVTQGQFGAGNYSFPGNVDVSGSLTWGNSNTRTEWKHDAGAMASRSGFFETDNPVNYPAGASGWWHLIESRHSNNSNNFALQIAGSFMNQDLYTRKIHDIGGRAWSKFVLQDENGNVNVGTSASSKLTVEGNIDVKGNINAKYQDVAEWVESSQKLEAGTVVALDPEKSNQVLASSEAYDTRVAGVISAQPGISLGERGEGKVLVATTGRVKVKVDARRAPIKIGDLLVTSDVQGVAMKSEPISVGGRRMHSPGTLIGKALEPLAKGTGEILVLLSLQ